MTRDKKTKIGRVTALLETSIIFTQNQQWSCIVNLLDKKTAKINNKNWSSV